MLTANLKLQKTIRSTVVLLIFISLIAFHKNAQALTNEKLTQEYRLKGYNEQQKGNLNEALTYYIKAVGLGLESPIVYNDMGILYEQIGADQRAEQAYLKAVGIDQKYLPVYSNLAYFYLKQGNTKKAYEYFSKRFELSSPSDPWAQKAKEEMFKLNPALGEKLRQDEINLFNKEMAQRRQREFYENVKISQEHYNKGIEYHDQGQFQEAIREFDQALMIVPNNPTVIEARKKTVREISRLNIEMHYDKALELLDSGDSASAKNEIHKILATIPNEQNTNSK